MWTILAMVAGGGIVYVALWAFAVWNLLHR